MSDGAFSKVGTAHLWLLFEAACSVLATLMIFRTEQDSGSGEASDAGKEDEGLELTLMEGVELFVNLAYTFGVCASFC